MVKGVECVCSVCPAEPAGQAGSYCCASWSLKAEQALLLVAPAQRVPPSCRGPSESWRCRSLAAPPAARPLLPLRVPLLRSLGEQLGARCSRVGRPPQHGQRTTAAAVDALLASNPAAGTRQMRQHRRHSPLHTLPAPACPLALGSPLLSAVAAVRCPPSPSMKAAHTCEWQERRRMSTGRLCSAQPRRWVGMAEGV